MEIVNYIKKYSGVDREKEINIDKILSHWKSGRQDTFIKLFGGSTTYRFDTKYEKTLDDRLEEFWDKYYYYGTWNDAIQGHFRDDWYDSKFSITSKDDIALTPSHLFREEYIGTNVYLGPDMTISGEIFGDKPIKITTGMKFTKVLSKLCPTFIDPRDLENFRIAQSQMLNDAVINAEVVLSIEPMDYFTMSDNNSRWSSCMSWVNNGCYHRGTVEMFTSPYVLVAYIESKTDEWFAGRPSKKWRELFIINQDLIAGIKGYPFWNRHLEKTVILELSRLAVKNLGWMQFDHEDIILCDADCNEDCDGYQVADLYRDSIGSGQYLCCLETCDMYNDFRYTHNIMLGDNVGFTYNYSGPTVCMCCGEITEREDYDDFEDGDPVEIICAKCMGCLICDNCDAVVSSGDCYIVDGTTYCYSCYHRHFVYTQDTDERIPYKEAYACVIDRNVFPSTIDACYWFGTIEGLRDWALKHFNATPSNLPQDKTFYFSDYNINYQLNNLDKDKKYLITE